MHQSEAKPLIASIPGWRCGPCAWWVPAVRPGTSMRVRSGLGGAARGGSSTAYDGLRAARLAGPSAGMQESMQPTALAFAAGLAMPTRDARTSSPGMSTRLRAAVLASGLALPSCREFHAARICRELRLCAHQHGRSTIIDKVVRRICSKILAEMLLAVPLELRALVQLDVLEMIGMVVVEDKTGLVLVERAGVASSG